MLSEQRRKNLSRRGLDAMRYLIVNIMDRTSDDVFDVDSMFIYLKLNHVKTTRRTVQVRMLELCSAGKIKRVGHGIYSKTEQNNAKIFNNI